jgi:threonine synthase
MRENRDKDIPIILHETAHPAKFSETIKKAIGIEVDLPEVLFEAMHKEKKSIEIDADLESLKKYLLTR